ncbi:VWA domain-containing protein [Actinokineospora sp. NBRC 105648]|uniref:vWA domain-containing protein n=1 Tax=Actinokineospora sp. NBRC 105648 TaxID=3032206 RepID=UPI0024A44BA1|nr:VWA domain-containing protein [Actinokineospora sp. NBRC 105648]GLZ41523.1 VWA domain-containing protein [Actinokineospora sp. NBRC 105648]
MSPVDPLPGLVGFAVALREAGVACGPSRVRAFLAAIHLLDPGVPGQLYWAGRLTLCAEPDDLPRYDTAFHAWFTGDTPRVSRVVKDHRPKRSHIAALAVSPDSGIGEEDGVPHIDRTASPIEVLRDRDISGLTAAERAHLREMIDLLRPEPPQRAALRWRPDRRGRIDARRTVRIMRAAGGEPIRLARKRRGTRSRRVVLLIDVSGSMSPYADALLRFGHAVTRRMPAEVFTLGTRLTRLTRQLRQRDPELALAAAARAVPDFAGGTRLGETLRAFLDRWGQRGVARQAVVVVFSDGWERGDVSLLGEQMARLGRLAHRVLWVNPHAGSPTYEPVQSGIAVALPHIDRLLAGHSVATLDRLLQEVRRA